MEGGGAVGWGDHRLMTVKRYEERLDRLMAEALPTNNQALHDYALLKFELDALRRQVERLALCPDHRDKADGRCIVCVAEERTRAEVRRSRDER